jgi:tRNA(fMet)-specific endonuclease VapC
MGIVLDSSVLIAAERRRFDFPRLLSGHPNELFFITSITASELLHGCERAVDAAVRERRKRFVEDVLQDYAILPFRLPEAREHARIWAELEKKGTLIGERDLFIAAIAKTAGYALATLNRDEFARVPALPLIDVGAFELTGRK